MCLAGVRVDGDTAEIVQYPKFDQLTNRRLLRE
jgi:hypothetical protein